MTRNDALGILVQADWTDTLKIALSEPERLSERRREILPFVNHPLATDLDKAALVALDELIRQQDRP